MTVKSSKNIPRNKPELLAPAGDFPSFQGAIQGGCDALYFGVGELNMRRSASHFLLSDLAEIQSRCRDANIRAYLTLNSLVFPGEEATVQRILDAVAPVVDAVICWDPMVIQACRSRQLPIHISTQASVSNSGAARMYADLGAVRVIPARECTLGELVQIKREAAVELEAFVHGAMCVGVSGRCFLSDLVCGKSGNRGECTQNCRREYRVTDVEDGHEFVVGNHYIMSAKDLCALPFIHLLCDAGLDAFKIEGRGRSPEYVYKTVGAYRAAIDSWADNTWSDALKSELMKKLSEVYHRSFCDGFYMGRPISEFTASGGKGFFRKEYIGEVTNFFQKVGVAEVLVQDHLFECDTPLLIIGNTTGVLECSAKTILQNERQVARAQRGTVTFAVPEKVRRGDKVYRQVPRAVTESELAVRPAG